MGQRYEEEWMGEWVRDKCRRWSLPCLGRACGTKPRLWYRPGALMNELRASMRGPASASHACQGMIVERQGSDVAVLQYMDMASRRECIACFRLLPFLPATLGPAASAQTSHLLTTRLWTPMA